MSAVLEAPMAARVGTLAAVLTYAADGYYPFPWRAKNKGGKIEKLPAVKAFQLSQAPTAPPDTARLREWFGDGGDFAAHNVGIATGWRWDYGAGKAVPFAAVDEDVSNGKNGRESWAALLKSLSLTERDVATLTQNTWSGGRHFVFMTTGMLKNAANHLREFPGIDVRSAGGWLAVSPSTVHGKAYDWVNPNVEPIQMPAALEAAFPAAGAARKASDNTPVPGVDPERAAARAVAFLQSASIAVEGEAGDSATYRVAAELKDMGCTQVEAVALLDEHYGPRCAPPWSFDELETITANAFKYGKDRPGIAAPEAVFATVDVFTGAESWTKEQIVLHAVELLKLKTSDAQRFDRLALGWALCETMEDAELDRLVATAASKLDERTPILYRPDDQAKTVRAIEAALIADTANEQIFSYASAPVAIRKTKPATVREMSGGDYPAMPLIARYDVPGLTLRINESVRLETADKDGKRRGIGVPEILPRMLLSLRGGNAPRLTGIIEAPTVRRNGTLLSKPGYDAKTGLFAQFDAAVFPIDGKRATKREAQAALKFIQDEVFAEFPFATPLDRTAAAAALVTGLVRLTLEGDAPGFMVSSPAQGSGKSALTRTISHAAYGRSPAATNWPSTDEEMSKFLIATLREGQRAIMFDNLPDGTLVKSAQLAAAMTSDTYSARVLGGNDTLTVPTAVTWFITGNNIHLGGDLPSRFVEIYLDAKDERPDRRAYARALVPWIAERRPQIVLAAITIVRAYFAAGCLPLSAGHTRFKDWDAMVRLPLVYAGGEDVAAKFDKAHGEDPVLSTLRELLAGWRLLFTKPVTIADMLRALDAPASGFDENAQAMKDALRELIGERKAIPLSAKSIGRRLKQFENRVAAGARLVCFENRDHVMQWAIEIVEPS